MTRNDPLTRDEETRHVEEYRRTGDRRIEERLVRSQLGLVWQLARSHRASGIDVEDLAQEGALGLVHAIRRFDPARGVRLSTYASWWIRAYQYRHLLHNHRLVRVGTTQAQRRVFFRLAAVRARLEAAGLEATPERIARILQVDADTVRELVPRLVARDASLDAALPTSDVSADDEVGAHELASLLRQERERFRAGLDARRRTLFDARWLDDEPPTLKAMGDRLGVTRERARQLEQHMLRKLRERVEARLSA
jgi:RNA polymerase sigma-32 factor